MKAVRGGRPARLGASSRRPGAGLWALLVALAGLCPCAPAAEAPGWYRVELPGGEPITARLISDEPGFYMFSFQGSILKVAKGGVRKLERLSVGQEATARPAAKAPATAAEAAKVASTPTPEVKIGQPKNEARDGALRDAVESLSSPNEEEVRRSYGLLEADFAAARGILHIALEHHEVRVRALSVKLLGEQGGAREDLQAVTGRLADDAPQVRLAAILALRSLGPAGLPALVDHLREETEPGHRKMGVKTLQLWKDRRAVVPLVNLLAREEDGGVKNFIATALQALTGEDLGKDAAVWAAFLSDEKLRQEVKGKARALAPGPAASPNAKR